MLENPYVYQRGLREWLRGKNTEAARAAGCNAAEVLAMVREFLREKK